MSKIKTQKIIRIVTSLITVVALVFVAERILKNQIWNLHLIDAKTLITISLAGGMGYFAATVFQPISWRYLLLWFGESPRDFKNIYSIYGRTQIAKYVPGNVFHIANRHVMSLQAGSKNAPLLGAATFELLSYLFVSALLCLAGYAFGARFEGLPISRILLVILAVVILFGLFFYFLPKIAPKIPALSQLITDLQSRNRTLGKAILSYLPIFGFMLAFFAIASLIYAFIIIAVHGSLAGISIPLVLSIYSIAYLVGLITPGAPAGIGVRETIMILLLTPYLGASEATLIALISRLVTVIGDLLFFLAALIVEKTISKSS